MGLMELLKQGKQVGMALLMAGSLSCVYTPSTAVFHAKNDYQSYPKYKKEIATYNIKNILNEICKNPIVNDEGFSCEYARCRLYMNNPSTSWIPYYSIKHRENGCTEGEIIVKSFRWNEIETVSIGADGEFGACLEINNQGCATVPEGERGQGQLPELVEAINIYLQETRNKAPSDKPTYVP